MYIAASESCVCRGRVVLYKASSRVNCASSPQVVFLFLFSLPFIISSTRHLASSLRVLDEPRRVSVRYVWLGLAPWLVNILLYGWRVDFLFELLAIARKCRHVERDETMSIIIALPNYYYYYWTSAPYTALKRKLLHTCSLRLLFLAIIRLIGRVFCRRVKECATHKGASSLGHPLYSH